MEAVASENKTQPEVVIKEKTPRIGIVAYSNGSSIGASITYLTFLRSFSPEIELIFPTTKQIRTDLDLLVLPGGPDVDPLRYANFVSFYTGKPDPIREWFDVNVLPEYIEARVPIFGICRGHQTLAVHFGVKLTQHMYHETSPDNERDKLVHKVGYWEDKVMKCTKVNSLHHQTVKVCPENAEVAAWYSSDTKNKGFEPYKEGIHEIEALVYKDYPIASVQWHPEEIYDDLSCQLVYALMDGKFDYRDFSK